MTHRNAYILLSVVALLWAGNYPASKIGLSELGPITRTMARAVLVTPVLILLARILPAPSRPSGAMTTRRSWSSR
jgi:drug/metabolite transporter (DMT)-like permease